MVSLVDCKPCCSCMSITIFTLFWKQVHRVPPLPLRNLENVRWEPGAVPVHPTAESGRPGSKDALDSRNASGFDFEAPDTGCFERTCIADQMRTNATALHTLHCTAPLTKLATDTARLTSSRQGHPSCNAGTRPQKAAKHAIFWGTDHNHQCLLPPKRQKLIHIMRLARHLGSLLRFRCLCFYLAQFQTSFGGRRRRGGRLLKGQS